MTMVVYICCTCAVVSITDFTQANQVFGSLIPFVNRHSNLLPFSSQVNIQLALPVITDTKSFECRECSENMVLEDGGVGSLANIPG